MSVSVNYPFSVPTNYSLVNTEIVSDKAKLLLQNSPFTFLQQFPSDTGFTYNAANTEFTAGLMRQKDQRPANALFYNNFLSKDGVWGNGVLTGTLVGSASVSGGILNITSGNGNYVQYGGASNMPSANKGCIRFTYTPNYSGAPSGNNYLVSSSQAENNINNLIRLIHTGTTIRIDIYDSVGASVLTSQTGNTFNPVAGTPYEFEFNWDADLGQHRLYIGGTLINGTKAGTGTLGSRGFVRQSQDYVSALSATQNGSFDNLIIFSEPQHTGASYAIGGAIPQTAYAADQVTLPAFNGTILGVTGFSVVDVGAPRFTLDNLYWNGSAWAASSNTYATANTEAQILANIGTFPFSPTQIIPRVYWDDSNTQSSVDDLAIPYTGLAHIDGYAVPASAFYADTLNSAMTTEIVTGLDTVRYILEVNGTPKYWNGSAWATSNLSYAQSNTFADFNTNLPTALTDESICRVYFFLHSNDGTTTPQIDDFTIAYDFNFANLPAPKATIVYGFLRDASSTPVVGATVSFTPKRPTTSYSENSDHVITNKAISVLTDIDGEFWTALIPGDYQFQAYSDEFGTLKKADGSKIFITIPLAQEVNITDQISP